MSTPLCFIDTETTGLHPEALAWEFAAIRVGRFGVTDEYHFFIDVPLDQADLKALRIGGFYDRHPYMNGPSPAGIVHSPRAAAMQVESITRDAILVGSNPDYDARILDRLLREHAMVPAWHYRTLDVITFAAGRLARSTKAEHRALVDEHPWRSDQIAAALGVTATPEDRHTALGDARWTKRIYDAAVTR